MFFFFFSSRRRHTRFKCDWSSDVCSSDLRPCVASTLVAVAGDHGESLGEHGEATHGLFVYESAVRIPMILCGTGGSRAGRRVPALVPSIDLAPTLLAAAHPPALPGPQGPTLLPLVPAPEPGPPPPYSDP